MYEHRYYYLILLL